jgi:ethanolamine ammonia-lyase small subunit
MAFSGIQALISSMMESGKRISGLKKWTMARVAIGRTGRSEQTAVSLAFKQAHALARDAVHAELDTERLQTELAAIHGPVVIIQSLASDRISFLQRPDWGRLPDERSKELLAQLGSETKCDIVFVIADGLSAIAVQEHVCPLLELLIPVLQHEAYSVGPLIIARQARVALGDYVGHALGARLVVVLIGERPGLSAADSLGAYITYQPVPGTTDEARNCISNIRPEGLTYHVASTKLLFLIREALRKGITGVSLKDESDGEEILLGNG